MSSTEDRTLHSKGPALSTVLATGSTWERTLVPIGPAARVALFSLTALVLLALVGPYLLAPASPAGTPDLYWFGWPWVVGLILDVSSLAPLYASLAAIDVAACVLTEGFSTAGRRMHIGLGALAILSGIAVLPILGVLLITVLNLAGWVVLVVVGAGVMIALLAGALDA